MPETSVDSVQVGRVLVVRAGALTLDKIDATLTLIMQAHEEAARTRRLHAHRLYRDVADERRRAEPRVARAPQGHEPQTLPTLRVDDPCDPKRRSFRQLLLRAFLRTTILVAGDRSRVRVASTLAEALTAAGDVGVPHVAVVRAYDEIVARIGTAIA